MMQPGYSVYSVYSVYGVMVDDAAGGVRKGIQRVLPKP